MKDYSKLADTVKIKSGQRMFTASILTAHASTTHTSTAHLQPPSYSDKFRLTGNRIIISDDHIYTFQLIEYITK
ncbi:hypothetical protein FTO70_12080 [Methanosarcina sp. KYL-1]|nr:hypothetical protein [Methanosarcina sp. KYL-1]